MSEIVPFTDAIPGQSSYVYDDEYGWVTDPNYFADLADPVTVKRQVWMLVSEDRVTFHPSTELCRECGGEPDQYGGCGTCDGDGRDPMAGRMEAHPS